MPYKITERVDSRSATSGPQARVELRHTIFVWDEGDGDDVVAHAAYEELTPTFYRGLARQSTEIDPIAPGVWAGTAHYGPIQPIEVGQFVVEFDTGSGTEHVSHSLATVASYAREGETAPNFGRLINVTKDGVEGVDIDATAFRATCRLSVAPEAFDAAYIYALAGIAKHINDAPFFGWAAGEVRFDNGVVTASRADRVELLLNFSISLNATGLSVDGITGIAKKGWEYLWVLYEDIEDVAAKHLAKRPKAVYVEQLYYDGDFSILGIGS